MTERKRDAAEFARYNAMRARCHNPNNIAYHNYGGRGIALCDRWLNGDGERSGYECFLADMGPRPVGMSLDRIDNNKGYSPPNCRWATRAEQHSNMRTNRIVYISGEGKTVAEWARHVGIPKHTILRRLDRGWDAAEAVLHPIDPHKSAMGRLAGLHRQHGNRFSDSAE